MTSTRFNLDTPEGREQAARSLLLDALRKLDSAQIAWEVPLAPREFEKFQAIKVRIDVLLASVRNIVAYS